MTDYDESPPPRKRRNPWLLLVLAALLVTAGLYAAFARPLPGRVFSIQEEVRVKYLGHAEVTKSGAACADCHRTGRTLARR